MRLFESGALRRSAYLSTAERDYEQSIGQTGGSGANWPHPRQLVMERFGWSRSKAGRRITDARAQGFLA